MKQKIFMLIAAVMMLSCEKIAVFDGRGQCGSTGPGFVDITDQCGFPEPMLGSCFYDANAEFDEAVFRSQDEYEAYAEAIRYSDDEKCADAQLPEMPFDQYTLLIAKTGGSGCSASYVRSVLKDDENKRIIYSVEAHYDGMCEMYIMNSNWVLVPKIPDDYTIEFQVE